MFWECPIVINLWTNVNLVVSSLLQIDWFANPSLCLLNDDSGLCISLIQKRMLFAGFTAAKTTIIQNWFTPHMCGKTYWIHSLLQIVTCECTSVRINGAKPSTIDAWQYFSSNIRDYIKEWLVFFFFLSLYLPSDCMLVAFWIGSIRLLFWMDIVLWCVWKKKWW